MALPGRFGVIQLEARSLVVSWRQCLAAVPWYYTLTRPAESPGRLSRQGMRSGVHGERAASYSID